MYSVPITSAQLRRAAQLAGISWDRGAISESDTERIDAVLLAAIRRGLDSLSGQISPPGVVSINRPRVRNSSTMRKNVRSSTV